jgi:hypothetical protein
MYIPTIGNEPSNDPVVYVCISILIFMIVLAVFLLLWTQWRSAREVWASVRKEGQFRHLRNSSRFVLDSELPSWDGSSQMEQGLVRISHRIPMADSDDGCDSGSDSDSEIDADEADALDAASVSKCSRYSDPPKAPLSHLTRTPPSSSMLDGFETVYDQFHSSKMVDSEGSDLSIGPNQRSSISERQFRELCLHGR